MHSQLYDGTTLTDLGKTRVSAEFTQAGYRNGQPIPIRPATLYYGEGVHSFTQPLRLQSGDILRGAGVGKTFLTFPSLKLMLGQGTYGPGPGWSWGGGCVWAQGVTEVGIEDLTIRFPGISYAGHHQEVGYNGVTFEDVQDCWVSNVEVLDGDNGFILDGTRITAQNVDVRVPKRGAVKYAMHYGFMAQGGTYILVQDFGIHAYAIHDLSVGNKSDVVVFKNGGGWDVNLDHHKDDQPAKRIMYSNVKVGKKTRLYANGGPSKPGYQWYGTGDVLWNVYGEVNGVKSAVGFIPSNYTGLTIVGNKTLSAPPTSSQYQEVIPLDALDPQELHGALTATPPPPPPATPADTAREKFRTLGFTDAEIDLWIL